MFCPNCGSAYKTGASFCGDCGKNIPIVTGPAGPVQPGKTGKYSNKYPFIAAGLLCLAIAVIASSYFFIFRDDGSVMAQNTQQMNSSSNTPTHTSTTTSSQSSNTSITTSTSTPTNFRNDNFASSFDSLVSENKTLEMQIVSTATEINRVAPTGITNSMLTSISDLKDSFLSIKKDASTLNPTASYAQSRTDFLKLVDFNITRSDALYRGSVAWKNNNPSYLNIFLEGQQAKDAYNQLLPVFNKEYSDSADGD
ncbi:MAG: zinc ribbon domain-containing protein [Thermoleophilia bacterium]